MNITEAQFQKLLQAQSDGNFTEFYRLQYEYGSAIAGLYIAGPTGQGVFGAYSHNFTTDYVSEDHWLAIQTQVSEALSSHILSHISSSFDAETQSYKLPQTEQILKIEIDFWHNNDLGLPPESYAGYDMIDFLRLSVDGALDPQDVLGALGDLTESMLDTNRTHLLIDGQVYTIDEAAALGVHPYGVGGDWIDSNGQYVPVVSGVFTYKGVRYHSGQLIKKDGVLYVYDDVLGRDVPVGLSNWETGKQLARILNAGGFTNDPTLRGNARLAIISLMLDGMDVNECFAAGTMIEMWGGGRKAIEQIISGDLVVSYDESGALMPGRVVGTSAKSVTQILDLFGTKVTPGHVCLCADGPFKGDHVPLLDILRTDGALVLKNGSKVRSTTGAPLGTHADKFIVAVTGPIKSGGHIYEKSRGKIRAGTRVILPDGRDISIYDIILASGGRILESGLVEVDGVASPFHWDFTESLPAPEDYILTRSKVNVSEIYAANEWDGVRPNLSGSSGSAAGCFQANIYNDSGWIS